MTREEAKDTLRRFTREGTTLFSRHCRDRMTERGISTLDVQNLLMWGDVVEVEWDQGRQNWKCRVEGTDLDGEEMALIVGISSHQAIMITAC